MDGCANRGIIDAANRILRELLQKPAFKEALRSLFQNIDPGSSPELVRTIMWQDPEMLLSLLGALPKLANALIKGVDEVLLLVEEKFSPVLLHDFVESLLDEIDKESFERVIQNMKRFIQDLSPLFQEVWHAIDSPTSNTMEEK